MPAVLLAGKTPIHPDLYGFDRRFHFIGIAVFADVWPSGTGAIVLEQDKFSADCVQG